jgi:pyridoxamine 5'-phosphate oxidase family protein
MFSDAEVHYLKSQRLARLATVSKTGQPDVVPVGFEFDGKYFWVGSHSQDILLRSMKYLNVKNGNKLVSLAIDDLESVDPWKPREVKVYGEAEIVEHPGRFGPGKYLRITPKISWSFGIPGLKTQGPGWGRVKTIHR